MVLSFVKFLYASAQALPRSVADLIHPARCHLQSDTVQVKGLILACKKYSPTSVQGLSQLPRTRPREGNILKVQNIHSSRDVIRKTCPKASLGLSCEMCVFCGVWREQSCLDCVSPAVSASTRVPGICSCSKGTSQGLTTLLQRHHSEKRSVFPFCNQIPP